MVIDFAKTKNELNPVVINNENVETVKEYKYLGFIVDDKLNGNAHVNRIYKKANQRLFFLRKLKSLAVDKTILNLFYNSVVQSVISYCIVCWFGNLFQKDKKTINRIVKCANRLGCEVVSYNDVYEKAMVQKVENILNDKDHSLFQFYKFLLSSPNRLSSIFCRTERFRKSFVPTSIRKFNKSVVEVHSIR